MLETLPPPSGGVGTSRLGDLRTFALGRFIVRLTRKAGLVTWEISSEETAEFETGFAENIGLAESDARKAATARILAGGGAQ